MSRIAFAPRLAGLLALFSCGDGKTGTPSPPPQDGGANSSGADTGETRADEDTADDDDGGSEDEGSEPVCGEDNPYVSDPASAIYVCAEGDDAWSGTVSSPLATVAAALDLARARGTAEIVIGEGTFEATLLLQEDTGDGHSDNGIAIYGDGTEATILVPVSEESPVIRVTEATGVRAAGFTTQGGQVPLHASAGAEVSFVDIVVMEPALVGIRVTGSDTIVSATNLQVLDPQVAADVAQNALGVLVDRATFFQEGGLISGAVGAAILVEGDLSTGTGSAELSNVEVVDTLANADGLLGRGVQIQENGAGTLQDCMIENSTDAGIFVHRANIHVVDTLISTVQAGVVPGEAETTGDGIVLTQGEAGEPASWYSSTLERNTVDGAARAGIVIEDVTAALNGNITLSNGLQDSTGSSLFTQGSAVTSGADTPTALGGSIATVEFNLDLIDVEEYTD